HSTADGRWPPSSTEVSALRGPKSWRCPTNSSKLRGRMRAARGASGTTSMLGERGRGRRVVGVLWAHAVARPAGRDSPVADHAPGRLLHAGHASSLTPAHP